MSVLDPLLSIQGLAAHLDFSKVDLAGHQQPRACQAEEREATYENCLQGKDVEATLNRSADLLRRYRTRWGPTTQEAE